MSDLKLASVYVRSRLLITVLTVLSVALGLGLAVIVLLMSHQTQALLGSETASWDLVVGAKGSPLQLVLNSLYPDYAFAARATGEGPWAGALCGVNRVRGGKPGPRRSLFSV